MTGFMHDQTFVGFGFALFDNLTAAKARWTFFTETPAAFQNLAGIADCLLGRVSADAFHRTIPGGYTTDIVKCEYPIGHGVDYLLNKMNVPDFVGF
jgi:hypothetical protein